MSLSKKNRPVKGLCNMCFICLRPLLPSWDSISPPLTHCLGLYSILIHTGKRERGGDLTREKVGWAIVHIAGSKSWLTDLQSINSIYVLPLYWGYIFFKNGWQHIFFYIKNIYKMTDSFYWSICTLATLIFFLSKTVHFLIFSCFALSCPTSPAAPAAGSAASGPAPANLFKHQ